MTTTDTFPFTRRTGDAPKTGLTPPQLQFSDESPRDIYRHMHEWAFSTFARATGVVREHDTLISVATTRALWLDEAVPTAHPDAFMPPAGNREFAHLHRDGSLHVCVSDGVAEQVLDHGWGLLHPWKDRGVNEILVYAPRNLDETRVAKWAISRAYEYATGNAPGLDL